MTRRSVWGAKELQPVTELKDYGISNAIFIDPFGYRWSLHQIHKVVSYEERIKMLEEQMDK